MSESAPDLHPVARWAVQAALNPVHVDCVITVMLKILDGKCKMLPEEKHIMVIMYDAVKSRPSKLLGADIHALIRDARLHMDEERCLKIYEQCLYAETMLGRPTMKAFKAMLREAGIIGNVNKPLPGSV